MEYYKKREYVNNYLQSTGTNTMMYNHRTSAEKTVDTIEEAIDLLFDSCDSKKSKMWEMVLGTTTWYSETVPINFLDTIIQKIKGKSL